VVVTAPMGFPSVPVTALLPLVRVTVTDEVTALSPASKVWSRLASTYSVPLMVPGAVVTPWLEVVVAPVVTVRAGLTPVAGLTKVSAAGLVRVTT
jgi:hypothetical protein